jgi:signal peptidase II
MKDASQAEYWRILPSSFSFLILNSPSLAAAKRPSSVSFNFRRALATRTAMSRRTLLLALIAITLLADQATKVMARASLRGEAPRRIGVLTLVYAENSGAFLSLGENLPPRVRTLVFDGIVAIGLGLAGFFLLQRREGVEGDDVALALIFAGGVGNLIDRLRFGWVTDFIYLSAGPLSAFHTGVFNVADMAITGGVLWLLLSWLFSARTPGRPERSPSPPNW